MQELNIDRYREEQGEMSAGERISPRGRCEGAIASAVTLKCSVHYVGTRIMGERLSAYQYTEHIIKDAMRCAILQKCACINTSGKFYAIHGLYEILQLENNFKDFRDVFFVLVIYIISRKILK